MSSVDKDILSANEYLSCLTNYVMAGFFEAFPYTGFNNLVLFGSIDPSTPVNFTKAPPTLFFRAGAIKIDPSNSLGFYSVK